MRKNVSGYTMIELLVVIAIIGVLTSISIVVFPRIQSDSRDSIRLSKITVISEALEKYYDQKGEYPSCVDMMKSSELVTTNTLVGMDPNALTSPSDSVGTNSITSCTDNPTSDTYSYIGDSNGYILKYKQEATQTVKSVTSKKTVSIITAIGTISGTTQIGSVLTAGTRTPSLATVSFQWKRADTSGGNYTDISNATLSAYTLTSADLGKYIKVTVTGIGNYSGSATSDASSVVVVTSNPITGIASISGTTNVGTTLTAGAITPSGATVSYQWQSATSSGGTYTNISGATSSTYLLTSNETNKYIKVTVTGTGIYSASVASFASTIVSVFTGVVASGGQITDAGGFRTHTFTTDGNFTVTNGGSVTITAYGAGGAGGGQDNQYNAMGGTSGDLVALTLTVTTGNIINAIVGQGGTFLGTIDGSPGGYGYNYGGTGGYGSGYGCDDYWAYGGSGGGGSSAAIRSGVRLVEAWGGYGGRASDSYSEDCDEYWGGGGGGGGGGSNYPSLTTQYGGGSGGAPSSYGENGKVTIRYAI